MLRVLYPFAANLHISPLSERFEVYPSLTRRAPRSCEQASPRLVGARSRGGNPGRVKVVFERVLPEIVNTSSVPVRSEHLMTPHGFILWEFFFTFVV